MEPIGVTLGRKRRHQTTLGEADHHAAFRVRANQPLDLVV
jgi:hypothetical protein